MYERFYNFRESPFKLIPDTEYLYLSAVHADALSHLVYAIQQKKGIAMLTGEIGAGKTTLVRAVIRQLGNKIRVAHLVNSNLDSIGLFNSLLFELGEEIKSTNKFDILRHLQVLLLKSPLKRQTVLMIIDEAQNLSAEVLEEVRMLYNIETEKEKPIQILLVGQPELRSKINQPELEQLRQRIAVRYHLSAMSEEDTQKYILHRLKVAGFGQPSVLFTEEAMKDIYFYSGGLPRLINTICDNALLAGYVKETKTITGELMQEVITELVHEEVIKRPIQYTTSSLTGSRHFYGFREEPFTSQANNLGFLFLGAGRGEMIAQISRRIERSNFVQAILGPEGVGKTVITHALMESLRSSYRSLYLEANSDTPDSFLKRVCTTAGIGVSPSSTSSDLLWDFTRFVNHQFEQKKKIALVLDNIHQLNPHWFREIGEFFRSFISLGSNPVKFILVGNNSAENQVNQWQKQISAVDLYCVPAFNASETEAYIHHRLRLVSNEQRNKDLYYYPFDENAINLICQYTEGIPLQINRLCQSAIELGYIRRQNQIDVGIIDEIAKQLGYRKSDNYHNSSMEKMISSFSDLS